MSLFDLDYFTDSKLRGQFNEIPFWKLNVV